MISVLRHPQYARLFSAQILALLGTGLLTVALGLLAFDLAGADAGAVLATALTIKMVAYVGVAPVTAALTNRLPRKTVMIAADVLRASVAAALPFVSQVWQIYLLVFLLQAASATFTPTFQSTIPGLLPQEKDYTQALSLSRLAYDLEAIVSPILAAAALTVISYNNLFIGTVVGFIASAILVGSSKLPARTTSAATVTFVQRLTSGVVAFGRHPALRFVLCTNLTIAAATALVLVNSVVYTKVIYGLDDTAVAITLAIYGCGSVLVALNTPRLVSLFGVVATMTGGIGIIVIGLIAVLLINISGPAATSWPALLVAWFILGAGGSLIATPSSRLILAASTLDNRDFVYTAQFSLSHACFLICYPLAGWLGATHLTTTGTILLGVAFVSGVAATMVARRWRLAVRPSTGDHGLIADNVPHPM